TEVWVPVTGPKATRRLSSAPSAATTGKPSVTCSSTALTWCQTCWSVCIAATWLCIRLVDADASPDGPAGVPGAGGRLVPHPITGGLLVPFGRHTSAHAYQYDQGNDIYIGPN